MIKKILKRVFKRRKVQIDGPARIIPLELHGISRDQISYGALKVTDGLQAAGFQAYVVGGAVRDLLLQRVPKDFDVVTDATPEQAKKIFRRSRIIGRRFRLVHVIFGEEVVEVSTFRRKLDEDKANTDEHGRLLRDNAFGDQLQDAARRDFTVNALFYDPSKQLVYDYHQGYADTRNKLLRMIGDPAERYREDPVRMLRAVRLSAKLGINIDAATAAPIIDLKSLLDNVPSARLLDEVLKMLLSGHSVECVQQLRVMQLHHGLLPLLDVILEQPAGKKFVMLALKNTDERIAHNKRVSPAFLFAALLWHEVLQVWQKYQKQGVRPVPAMHSAMDEVLARQKEKLAIPHRHDATMKEIWLMQLRFDARSGQRPFRLLEQPRFRAAYDFMLLRCACGEVDDELGLWWDEFQHASSERRSEMLMPGRPKAAGQRKRKRKPRKKSAADRSDKQE